MREYVVTALIAAMIAYVATPLVIKAARSFGAIAEIRNRDVHILPTPRWGGIAMWLAMSLTFLIVNHLPLVGKSFGHDAQGIFLAATFITLLGALDDRFQLDALTKLAGQALAAGILLRYGIQILWLPINGVVTLPQSIGQFLTVLIVLVTINAVNFIDGLDGLASGIAAISAAAFFAFSYLLAVVYGLSRAGSPSLITAVVVGVCVGFLPYNLHPARIFMGDSGSMFLGLLLATSAITLTGQVDANAISAVRAGPTLLPLLLPFAVLAIPLLDFLLAVIRRIRAGKSPFAPDRDHLHHRLLARGYSHQRTAVIMYSWTATLAVPVTIAAFASVWVAALVMVALGGTTFLLNFRKAKVSQATIGENA